MRVRRLAPLVVLAMLAATVPATAQETEDDVWPDGERNPYERLPIRVAFLLDAERTRHTELILEEVTGAFRWWEAGGNGYLAWTPAFANASGVDEADLVVLLVNDDEVCGNPRAAGCGRPPVNGTQGVVVLPLLRPQGGHVPTAQMVLVARHEIGHALGLLHSDRPDDIMYPQVHVFRPPDSGGFTPYLPFLATGIFGAVILAVMLLRRRKQEETEPAPSGMPPCRTGPYHDFDGGVCTQCGHTRPAKP